MNIEVAIVFRIVIGVAVSLSANMALAQNFGKVFSSPQEREYLDREREEALRELSEEERLALLNNPPAQAPSIELAPMLIHMGGSLRRADGNHTIWLNGVPVSLSQLPDNVSLQFDRGLGVLRVQAATREFTIKPGQTLDADTGVIREDYELTEEELAAVAARVAAREAAANPVRELSAATPSTEINLPASPEAQETQELVEGIVEGLRLLQQVRDAQGSIQ